MVAIVVNGVGGSDGYYFVGGICGCNGIGGFGGIGCGCGDGGEGTKSKICKKIKEFINRKKKFIDESKWLW